jgi:hypothetical protein
VDFSNKTNNNDVSPCLGNCNGLEPNDPIVYSSIKPSYQFCINIDTYLYILYKIRIHIYYRFVFVFEVELKMW